MMDFHGLAPWNAPLKPWNAPLKLSAGGSALVMMPVEIRGRAGQWPVVRLKGGNKKAQGIALGLQREYNPVALKGRNKTTNWKASGDNYEIAFMEFFDRLNLGIIPCPNRCRKSWFI